MTLGRFIDALLEDPEDGERSSMAFGMLLWVLSAGFAATLVLMIAVVWAWLPFSGILLAAGMVWWGFARRSSRRR